MSKITPTILVIVGISGDLAKRKLLPAIREIAKSGVLPEQFKLIGITRRDLSLDEVLPGGDQTFLREHLRLYKMDMSEFVDYEKLASYLQELRQAFNGPTQQLFYLSVPPQVSLPVVELMGEAGLAAIPGTKVLLEKPFGTDLASATELIEALHQYFKEEQLYRIDHYLAKEMAQNLVVFRGSNSLFKRTWNKDFLESIEIIASEVIGVEGRGNFYEQTGALRDFVQSHLLQLAALTLMELPALGDWEAIPDLRLKALQQLVPPIDIEKDVIRGQYQGYTDEVHNLHSQVETFVSLRLTSKDKHWEGVPITLTTGKMLGRKTTEIRIRYRQDTAGEANELVLQIQPNEGVEVGLWAKKPGYEREPHKVLLKFAYDQHFEGLPEAYERVFVDAMRSDRTLFTTSEEVLASWRLLEPIQQAWAMAGRDGLITYLPGKVPHKK